MLATRISLARDHDALRQPTLSAADSLEDSLVSELELSRTGNELELVVDGVSVLLLQTTD